MQEIDRQTNGAVLGRFFQILAENAEIRKDPTKFKSFGFGKVEHRFPELDLILLKIKYPDLASPDKLTREIAWKKLRASDELDIYRVKPRVKIIPTSQTAGNHKAAPSQG
jgi:hypothetical protein